MFGADVGGVEMILSPMIRISFFSLTAAAGATDGVSLSGGESLADAGGVVGITSSCSCVSILLIFCFKLSIAATRSLLSCFSSVSKFLTLLFSQSITQSLSESRFSNLFNLSKISLSLNASILQTLKTT